MKTKILIAIIIGAVFLIPSATKIKAATTSDLVNGKTLQQRVDELYANLHEEGSADQAKANFPDLKLVYTDQGTKNLPSEILPFRYYYSKEAGLTISICNVDYTVFICTKKVNKLLTKNNSSSCTITSALTDSDTRLTIRKVTKVKVKKRYAKRIKLKWKKVKKAKYYQIKVLRKKNKRFIFKKRVRTKKNKKAKLIKKLTPEKTYFFRVRACKKGNNQCGAWSKRKKAKTISEEEEKEEEEEENAEDPVLELPLANTDNVTGIQVFNPSAGHTGFDFELQTNREIIAPIAGEVTQLFKTQMSNNLWIIDAFIKINSGWDTFIAFEPCTYEETVIDQQMNHITVSSGDIVTQGQSLGTLTPVIGSEFPHIHWQVQKNDGTAVNPYDYVSASAKAQMQALCDTYGEQCT